MKHAYISCPMTVSQTVLDEVIKLVHSYQVTPLYWKRETAYNEKSYTSIIKECDAFIIILPDLAWSYNVDSITSGSRKELSIASGANKPIYLAYKNKIDGLGIYSALVEVKEVTSKDNNSKGFSLNRISGLASTRYNFRDSMNAPKYTTDTLSHRQQALDTGAQYLKELNKDKTWTELQEELHRQYFQNMKNAELPARIDVSTVPPVDIGKIMDHFYTTGMLLMDTTTKLDVNLLTDNRIVLFF